MQLNYHDKMSDSDGYGGPDHANHGMSFLSFKTPVLWLTQEEFDALPEKPDSEMREGFRMRIPRWQYKDEGYFWILEIVVKKEHQGLRSIKMWHPIIVKGK